MVRKILTEPLAVLRLLPRHIGKKNMVNLLTVCRSFPVYGTLFVTNTVCSYYSYGIFIECQAGLFIDGCYLNLDCSDVWIPSLHYHRCHRLMMDHLTIHPLYHSVTHPQVLRLVH